MPTNVLLSECGIIFQLNAARPGKYVSSVNCSTFAIKVCLFSVLHVELVFSSYFIDSLFLEVFSMRRNIFVCYTCITINRRSVVANFSCVECILNVMKIFYCLLLHIILANSRGFWVTFSISKSKDN